LGGGGPSAYLGLVPRDGFFKSTYKIEAGWPENRTPRDFPEGDAQRMISFYHRPVSAALGQPPAYLGLFCQDGFFKSTDQIEAGWPENRTPHDFSRGDDIPIYQLPISRSPLSWGGGTPRVWVSFLGMDFSSQRGWGRELSSKLSRPCTYQPQSVVKIIGIRKSRLPAAILSDLLIPKMPFSRSFFLRVRVPKPVPVSGPVFRVGGGNFLRSKQAGPRERPSFWADIWTPKLVKKSCSRRPISCGSGQIIFRGSPL